MFQAEATLKLKLRDFDTDFGTITLSKGDYDFPFDPAGDLAAWLKPNFATEIDTAFKAAAAALLDPVFAIAVTPYLQALADDIAARVEPALDAGALALQTQYLAKLPFDWIVFDNHGFILDVDITQLTPAAPVAAPK